MTSDDWDRPIHEILHARTTTTGRNSTADTADTGGTGGTGGTESSAFATLRGNAAHAVLAETLRVRAERGLSAVLDAVPVLVDEHVRDPRFGRLDRARIQVTGLVCRYLKLYAPDAGADLAAAEYPIGDARIDLVWNRDGVGVWFDEIKTGAAAFALHTRSPSSPVIPTSPVPPVNPVAARAQLEELRRLDPAQISQARRYLTCGIEEFGPHFLGVRLLNLREPSASRHFVPDGSVRPLPANPTRPPYVHTTPSTTPSTTSSTTAAMPVSRP